jgi:hypothetical protein
MKKLFESQNMTDRDGSNQCCGSGMFIPDPGSRILIFTHPGSRIPDPGSQQQKREVKKN